MCPGVRNCSKTRKGKELVLKHVRNLKGKSYAISEQLPSGMKEHKMAQTAEYNNRRRTYPNWATHKIHFSKDRLIFNGNIVEPSFERNLLPKLDVLPSNNSELFHSSEIVVQGSTFQGHAAIVGSIEDAVKAREALFQDVKIPGAHHIMYAYHIDNEDGVFVAGNLDDAEYKGSEVLSKCIQDMGQENIFLAVSRIHDGPNLGRQRFTCIEQACREVISLITK